MTTLVLDTYRAMQTLQSHGYTKDQAEGMIEMMSQADLNHVATREDIHEMRAEISNVRSELRIEISDVFLKIESSKNEMLRWMIPLILGLYSLLLFKHF